MILDEPFKDKKPDSFEDRKIEVDRGRAAQSILKLYFGVILFIVFCFLFFLVLIILGSNFSN